MGAIVVGLAGVAWAAPARTTGYAGTVAIVAALALVAVPVAAPYALRRRAMSIGLLPVISAGCGYAWTGIASKLLTDELVAGALLLAVVWLATAAASEGLALLSEMSALQRRPATHVAPTMFAVQVLVPVGLAPLIFGESWSSTPLGRRRAGRLHGGRSRRHHAPGGLTSGGGRDRNRPRADLIGQIKGAGGAVVVRCSARRSLRAPIALHRVRSRW